MNVTADDLEKAEALLTELDDNLRSVGRRKLARLFAELRAKDAEIAAWKRLVESDGC